MLARELLPCTLDGVLSTLAWTCVQMTDLNPRDAAGIGGDALCQFDPTFDPSVKRDDDLDLCGFRLLKHNVTACHIYL